MIAFLINKKKKDEWKNKNVEFFLFYLLFDGGIMEIFLLQPRLRRGVRKREKIPS